MTEAITILPPVTSSQESPPAEIATMTYEPLPNPSKLIQKGSFEPLHQVWPSLFFSVCYFSHLSVRDMVLFHFLRQSGAGIMKLVHLPAAFITALILTLSLLIHCYTSTVIEFRATKNIHIAFIIQSTALGFWSIRQKMNNIEIYIVLKFKFNIKR